MTKPLTQSSSLFDDDDEPLQDNAIGSDLFLSVSPPKNSEKNFDINKLRNSSLLFEDDEEDAFEGLFDPKKKETVDPADSIFG